MSESKKNTPIRLVIVDDAPFIREILRKLALNSGMNVVGEADNGLDGIRIIEEHKPDVVLMDIVMPKKNGIDTTKYVLKKNPKLRVIACSTATHEKVIAEAINAGCCDYITKPFEGREVIKAIHKAMKEL